MGEILIEGLDETGRPVLLLASGYEAVVLQHEIDHLDGILFLDRIASVKTDLIRRQPRSDAPLLSATPPPDLARAFPALYEPTAS